MSFATVTTGGFHIKCGSDIIMVLCAAWHIHILFCRKLTSDGLWLYRLNISIRTISLFNVKIFTKIGYRMKSYVISFVPYSCDNVSKTRVNRFIVQHMLIKRRYYACNSLPLSPRLTYPRLHDPGRHLNNQHQTSDTADDPTCSPWLHEYSYSVGQRNRKLKHSHK